MVGTPNLPTKNLPTKIRRIIISGKFRMGLGIPGLAIKILLKSNPLKSRILVQRLAVLRARPSGCRCCIRIQGWLEIIPTHIVGFARRLLAFSRRRPLRNVIAAFS